MTWNKTTLGKEIKPGWATSEFWATIALNAAAITTAIGADGDWVKAVVLGVGGVVTAVYAAARTFLKSA